VRAEQALQKSLQTNKETEVCKIFAERGNLQSLLAAKFLTRRQQFPNIQVLYSPGPD
jgi:hypothetical protein